MRKNLFSYLLFLFSSFIFGVESLQIVLPSGRVFVGMNIQLSVKNPDNTLQYKWDFDDGSHQYIGISTRHLFKEPKSYKIKCFVRKSNGDTLQGVKALIVHENRKILMEMKYPFENSDIEFDTLNFIDSTLKWDYGDGIEEIGSRKSTHKYLRSGVFRVKVYDLKGKAKIPVIFSIRVLQDKRNISLVYENSYAGTPVEFNTINFVDSRLEWKFGDGAVVMGNKAITHIYKSPGTYKVKITDMAGKDKKKIVKQVIVRRDERLIIIPQKVIAGIPVNLDLKGFQSGNFEWKFNDGSTNSGNSIHSKIFKRAGIVKVTVSDKLKKSPPITKVIKIIPDLRSIKISKTLVLPGTKITLTALRFFDRQIKWDFGDGTIKLGNSNSINHKFSKLGKYKITAVDFAGKGKKTFQQEIIVTNALPGFMIEALEFTFTNGKYYQVVQKKTHKLDYNLRVKVIGTAGVLNGKINVDGITIGLFNIHLNGNSEAYLKTSMKPNLPLTDLGMHKLSFDFTNHVFPKQKPVLRYFVTTGKSISLKTPKNNSVLNKSTPIEFIWSTPYEHLDYEYAYSAIPFQFLNDNQFNWITAKNKNSVSLDFKEFKKLVKYVYLILRAKDKNGVVKTVSQIYSFRINKKKL